ncbi:MAG: hypothetical protein M3280_07575 [Actinomycetota bacterium]|nr:hypothetical protein [Actinomycetota bacterium]
MTASVAPERVTRREARGSLLLWFGVLGAPTAWAVQLLLTYSLEEWFACSRSVQDSGEVLGLGVRTVATAVTSLLALVAVVAGIVSVSCFRKLRRIADGDALERAHWMALAGIMNSVLYFMIILLSYGPPALLDVCAR